MEQMKRKEVEDENSNNVSQGLFDSTKNKERLRPPSMVKKTVPTSDQAAQEAAAALASSSSIVEKKMQKEAEEANKFTPDEIRLVKESIFQGFCKDVVSKEVIPGFSMKIELMSMSTNEYDFISQIVFDYKKDSLDDKGFNTICSEKFDSLFTGLLMATQIVNINDVPLVPNEKDLNNVKIAIKQFSKLELLGITDEKKMSELQKLKLELIDRAYVFMNMENNVQNVLNTVRAQFNERVGDLLGKNELVKK